MRALLCRLFGHKNPYLYEYWDKVKGTYIRWLRCQRCGNIQTIDEGAT